MIPDDIQALVLADAIGALDPDERRDLEARLAALPSSARAEVAHLYDASVEIAASASGEAPSSPIGNNPARKTRKGGSDGPEYAVP